MQELVLVTNFEELGRSPLVVIAKEFELRYSLLACFACPVCDFFVRTVSVVAVIIFPTIDVFVCNTRLDRLSRGPIT